MALFDLAITLGGFWNIDQLAADMPISMLNEWLAYFQIRPTASPLYRHAQTAGWVELFKIRFGAWFAHIVWAIYHFLTRHEETRELNDFVLRWLTPEEQEAERERKAEEGAANFMSLIKMYGKPVKNDND